MAENSQAKQFPKYNAEQLVNRYNQLKANRSNYENHWQECQKYCIPRRANITVSKTPGTKFDIDVYDSTSVDACNIMAAGFHSYLTNPSSEWFQLRIDNDDLNTNDEVKQWLKRCQNKIYNTLNNSNFPQQIHEVYLDLGSIGTSTLYEEEDPKNIVRFYARPIQEIFIAEDENERIDTVFRYFTLTVKQAYSLWGQKAGTNVLKKFEAREYDATVDFLHCVMPRWEREAGKNDVLNKPWASIYVSIKDNVIVDEGGYDEFPFFVVRFYKNSGDVYGTSPAMVALADIKMLNEMSKTIIRGAQKVVDPPIVLPHDGYILPLKTYPNAVNYKTETETPGEKIETLSGGANLPIGFEMQDRCRSSIERKFFVDLFLLLAQKEGMTATEVLQRVEEKMLILAPALGRLMSELLNPIIYRTFNILMRAGQLPEVPEVLKDQNYHIEYVSPLARAQKLDQMKSINNVINVVGAVAQQIPDVLDKIDADALVDEIGQLYNMNPKIIRSTEKAQATRQARQEAAMQQQKLMMMQQSADIVSTGAQAAKTGKEAAMIGAGAK